MTHPLPQSTLSSVSPSCTAHSLAKVDGLIISCPSSEWRGDQAARSIPPGHLIIRSVLFLVFLWFESMQCEQISFWSSLTKNVNLGDKTNEFNKVAHHSCYLINNFSRLPWSSGWQAPPTSERVQHGIMNGYGWGWPQAQVQEDNYQIHTLPGNHHHPRLIPACNPLLGR